MVYGQDNVHVQEELDMQRKWAEDEDSAPHANKSCCTCAGHMQGMRSTLLYACRVHLHPARQEPA